MAALHVRSFLVSSYSSVFLGKKQQNTHTEVEDVCSARLVLFKAPSWYTWWSQIYWRHAPSVGPRTWHWHASRPRRLAMAKSDVKHHGFGWAKGWNNNWVIKSWLYYSKYWPKKLGQWKKKRVLFLRVLYQVFVPKLANIGKSWGPTGYKQLVKYTIKWQLIAMVLYPTPSQIRSFLPNT